MIKKCELCGQEFETVNNVQKFCNRPVVRECLLCHKTFETKCNSQSPEFCSHGCASQGAVFKTYYCVNCGEPFHPKSSRQRYCKKPLHKICPMCGEDFIYSCSGTVPGTCGKKTCIDKYAVFKNHQSYQDEIRICEWCGKEFTPINNTQKFCTDIHYSNCVICGKQYEIDLTKNPGDRPKTCSKECSIQYRFRDGNPFKQPDFLEKSRKTLLKKYGVTSPMHSSVIQERMWSRYQEKTGYSHPSHNPAVRAKWSKSVNHNSSLEKNVAELLDKSNIEYIRYYMMNSDKASHEFDFYVPKYKILIDCDGIYYHSYLDDPDGKRVEDYYDEDRLALVPEDHIFHVIVEGQEDDDVLMLVQMMQSIDEGSFDYVQYMFNWCRSMKFPYPEYDDKRMNKDFKHLCDWSAAIYKPNASTGISIIKNFHHSMYSSSVDGFCSPEFAWNDDTLLKQIISKKLLYQNNVEPSKILKGFNLSEISPCVPIFNPVLAKHICEVYLADFESVFDPFSRFSGSLLGCAASNKSYIGQDIDESVVKESDKIIEFLGIKTASVFAKNVLSSFGTYDCLFTSVPEGQYDSVIKTQDEWIDECLSRFKCKKYVFVVTNTDKYKDNIVETCNSTSHYSTTKEHVVVL